jgi:flagellar biosynthesis/type III secretory pathway chaperone
MHADTHRTLEVLLDREIDIARSLQTTLDAERAALTGDSPDTVTQLAAEKVQLFAAIERLDAERRSLWNEPSAGGGGFAAALAERWTALLTLVAGCRTANEINGRIIHVRQHQIRQLMDIVRGGTALTYGPHGKASSTALRALARA